MENLLTINYWLNLRPDLFTALAWKLFIGLIILLAVLAILITIIKKRGVYRGVFKRLYGFCLGNTVIGLVLLFVNYEMVPFFSARFWLIIWVAVMIAWLIFIIKACLAIPRQKKELEKVKELNKYLP